MQINQFRVHSSILAVAASLMAPSFAHAQTAAATTRPAPALEAQSKSGEIVVTGTRADVIATPDRMSFNVANDLQAQTGTVADALRSVPGVEVDLQGRVSLRGDSGVEIMIDGRPSAMLRGDNRGDVLLSMPAGQIERVEVITNPSAAMSPEGSGGVINLVSKRARQDTQSATIRANAGLKGRGSLSLSGAQSTNGLTLTGDVNYRRFTAEGTATQTRSRLDPATGDFVTSRRESETENVNAFRSARIGVEYDLDKKNRLSTDFNYREGSGEVESFDQLESADPAASYERESEIDFNQRGFGGKASWRHTMGQDHEFVADLDVENGRMRRDIDAVTTFAALQPAYESIGNRNERGEYGLQLDYKKPTGEDSSLNLGYEGDLNKNQFQSFGDRGASFDTLLPVPALTNDFDYDLSVHALYGTYKFNLGKLSTQAGLRLEQADTKIDQITDDVSFENDYFRAYPTLHLGYELAENQQLRGSYSRRIQRPSPQDLNPYTLYIDPLNIRRGNPFLRPEVTDSFELGWNSRKGPTFYSLTGFYRRSRDGVTDILSDLGTGVFLTTRANLATAERVGAELIANGRFGKTLTYNASGTVFWNEINRRLGGISEPRSGTSWTARANMNWQPTANDFFQLNGFYSGKQLLPQGYRLGMGMVNLGYRRKIDEKLSFLVTAQNVLDTARFTTVFETPTIRDSFEQKGMGRAVLLGLSYNIGSTGNRKRQDPGFDFQGGGEVPQ